MSKRLVSSHSKLSYFVELSSFLRLKAAFLHLELARGTTIAAKIGQAVVDLKLEVKRELVLTHLYCHDNGSNSRSD